MNKTRLFAALVAVALPWTALAADLAKIVDPWVREAPPASQVMAAYMTIENPGPTPLHLVGATSPLFAKTELHQTVKKDGMTTMEAVGHMEIPAGGKVALAPGGLHLMLITPNKAMKSGDKVPMALQFAGSQPQTVEAVVRAGGGGEAAGQGGMEHQHQH